MLKEQDYLSWSQYSLWKSSKREFYKRYGLGEDRSQNKYFAKGKELGDALEYGDDGDISTDELLSVVLKMVPKLDIMEHKIKCNLSNGYTILSYLDSCKSDLTEFYEYKTSQVPWTQDKVDEHKQLDFYALALYIKSGRAIIPCCTLINIETEQTEQGLKYNGVIHKFERTFTENELLAFETELIKAIDEIDAFEYLELELDDEVVDRYIELTERIKADQAELDLIRLEIKIQMETEEVQYASATNGKFTMSKTKSWTYSKALTEAKATWAKQVAIAHKEEQKNGLATCTETESLRFSINKTE